MYCSLESPIIVAGEILNVEKALLKGVVGPDKFQVDAISLTINVRIVVKGKASVGICHVSGYGLSTGGLQVYHMNPAVPDFKKGQRRLFFLRKDKEKLRFARDLFDHSLPLYGSMELSEKHVRLDTKNKAVLLLLQHPAVDQASRWARDLPVQIGTAAQIIGPAALMQLIQSERLVQTAPSELQSILIQEVEVFRFSHPPRALANFAPPVDCPDFGQR